MHQALPLMWLRSVAEHEPNIKGAKWVYDIEKARADQNTGALVGRLADR